MGSWRHLAFAGLALLGAALALASQVSAGVITSAGPLEEIHASRVLPLDCQVMYAGIDYEAPGAESDGEYWGDDGSSLGPNACGTFLRLGATTYGPNVGGFSGSWNPGNPAPTAFAAVSQSSVLGTGTLSDPWRIVTSVTAANGTVELQQTDEYVTGSQYYLTTVTVTSNVPSPGGQSTPLTVFRGSDCYLEPLGANEDLGDYNFGWRDPATGAVACTKEANALGSRFIAWIPMSVTRGTVAGQEDQWDAVWDHIGTGATFSDSCVCTSNIDGGLGLSWSFSLAQGESATMVVRNVFGLGADFNAAPPASCSGPVIHFTPVSWDLAGLAFLHWDFGDGTQSTETSPSHEYAEPGQYQVTLTSIDEAGMVSVARRIVTAAPLECCPEPGSGEGAPGCPPPPQTAQPQDPISDVDMDGVADDADNCPSIANKGQADADHDGLGDACDDGCGCGPGGETDFRAVTAAPKDQDMDGVIDAADNCPAHPNHDQADLDQDTLGDACDVDADGDGVLDLGDNCPRVANLDQADLDGDGIGDACDTEPAAPGPSLRGRALAAPQTPAAGPSQTTVLAVGALLGTGALVIGALFVHGRRK